MNRALKFRPLTKVEEAMLPFLTNYNRFSGDKDGNRYCPNCHHKMSVIGIHVSSWETYAKLLWKCDTCSSEWTSHRTLK